MIVLVVDDDENCSKLIAGFLVRLEPHWNPVEARSCNEAKTVLQERHDVDCVLIDHLMFGVLGTDCVKELRSVGYKGAIILFSGHMDESIAIEAIKNGADDFLVKGNKLSKDLPKFIRSAVERRMESKITSIDGEEKMKELNALGNQLNKLEMQIRKK